MQASAALPGAFNAVTLPVGPHAFEKAAPFRSFKLTDGGVYDNMGTEWPIRLIQRLREGTPPPALATADELVVVNGSAGQGVVKRTSLLTPLLGEITTLLAGVQVRITGDIARIIGTQRLLHITGGAT